MYKIYEIDIHAHVHVIYVDARYKMIQDISHTKLYLLKSVMLQQPTFNSPAGAPFVPAKCSPPMGITMSRCSGNGTPFSRMVQGRKEQQHAPQRFYR